MAEVTAADVRRLREATGAGMMDCKRALEETAGDVDQAVELLRIKGAAKAQQRGADRIAANGLVAAADGAMIELACETDFVAKGDQFQQLAADVVAHAAATKTSDLIDLLAATLADGRTVQESVEAASAVIGEKLELRRVAHLEGTVTSYLHRRSSDLPPQVGVLVAFEGHDPQVARGAAMQIAAMRPRYVGRADVPADVVESERRIAAATAREEGKPEQALTRIVEGRIAGFYKDAVLLDQASVQDTKKTVAQVLSDAGVTVRAFVRFEVGTA